MPTEKREAVEWLTESRETPGESILQRRRHE